MSHVVVRRAPRAAGPQVQEGELQLEEPPVMPEQASFDLSTSMMAIPMTIGPLGTVLLVSGSAGAGRSPLALVVVGGAMVLGVVAMAFGMAVRPQVERRRKGAAERRDYLRYLAQKRVQVRDAARAQREAVAWDNPAPAALPALAGGPRLWERRGSHDDFGRVRIGLGTRSAALRLLPPTTRPVEDLDPLCAQALRRFSEAYSTVSDIPVSVGLRSFVAVELAGDDDATSGLARALLGQLATFHSPDELRVAVLVREDLQGRWDWVKWLPHCAHPDVDDGTGPVPLLACDHDELLDLLGAEVTDRGEHDRTSAPSTAEPMVVVLAHGVDVPATSPLRGAGLRGVVLLDASGRLPGGRSVLRLQCDGDRVTFPSAAGTSSALADASSRSEAEQLARELAPWRTGGAVEVLDRPFDSDFELTALLGVRDLRTYDVAAQWRTRLPQKERLRVPVGVTEDGEVVELDLKESAQGGMGPHGLLIGATGSGKSELLRTLVCSLAATHSSEILNLVLVDFKGGATFLGMEDLPHTSAVITNLADELPLVDRMQDSISGELVRRQELLREAGHASLFDYERARLAGAPLAPLPSLVVVVDEFSELLSSKPEFMDLFVSVGRLGRSLGVHLLLASQRIDEGRINRVEGHLSYRLALKTFSSMESRSVIGVADAYELPPAPGNGYLKVDGRMTRFKSAYVSGPCARPAGGAAAAGGADDAGGVLPFHTHAHPGLHALGPAELPGADGRPEGEVDDDGTADPDAPSVMEVLQGRLAGAGPAARQVWLPPLSAPPTLDALLPGVVPDGARGLSVDGPVRGRLRVPLGVVDRPQDQVRDVLVVDLAGARGHVGVVGAAQMGKSTLLRTLVLGLALTHTPREVQVYALDMAGGGLGSVRGLPHVGSVAGRLDRERASRTVREVVAVMEAREAAFAERGVESMEAHRRAVAAGEVEDAHGDVFLVIDGWGTLHAEQPELEGPLAEVAARGLSFGVHLVVSATRWSEVRPWLRDVLGTKLELRLGDPMDSEVRGRLAAGVPALPGRGLTPSGDHFLAALPRLDGRPGTDDLADATREACAESAAYWPGPPAPEVRMLPRQLAAADLPAPDGDLRVSIALDEDRLEPVRHDFATTPHLMVLGDQETGRTNLLRLVVQQVLARYGPGEAKVLLADPERRMHGLVPRERSAGTAVDGQSLAALAASAALTLSQRVPGQDVDPAQLRRRDWWSGAQLFVVLDDYELLGGGAYGTSPLDPLLPLLAQGAHIGLHVVVARSSANAARGMSDPLLRRLWELGTPGLLFSCAKEEGRFLGEAAPRTLPPGRAQLVTRRSVRLVQTACAPAPAWRDDLDPAGAVG